MKFTTKHLLVLLIILLTITNLLQRKRRDSEINKVKIEFLNEINGINNIRWHERELTGLSIGNMRFLRTKKNDSISLQDLFAEPRVILFVAENNCEPCLDSVLECLVKHFGKVSQEICFIAGGSEFKKLQLIEIEKQISYPIYLKDGFSSSQNFPDFPITFLCIIDQKLEIKKAFIPSRTSNIETMKYLDQTSKIKNLALTD